MTKDVPAKVRPQKVRSLDKRKAMTGWIFVLPFVIGFLVIYLPIIIDSLKYSFCEIKILSGGGYQLTFVGWKNYQEALFEDPDFVQVLLSGLRQLVLDVPAIVIFSLFMAVMLNGKIAGRAAFRTIFFIPVILSTGVLAAIDASNVFLENMGNGSVMDDGTGSSANITEVVQLADLTWLFESMQVGTELLTYAISLVNGIFNIINRSGVQMLIFLAALQSISPSIYESCSIDGASTWETFWKITIPMVSPMILVNAIYTLIDSFTSSSNAVMSFIEAYYNLPGKNVVATAMSWVYFLIVILAVALIAGILSAFVFYQRRD